jgi:predicted solute-binding protein
MGKKAAKKTIERSNVAFMQKLIKKSATSARGNVAAELDMMMKYVLNDMNSAMGSIVSYYAKKEGTVKPKVVQAAFQAILSDELRQTACAAGADALIAFVEGQKTKAVAKKEKKVAVVEAAA